MSAPFAGGFNRSFLNASKHALRSVTFSSALHFAKLGPLTSQMAAIKQAMHITSSAVLTPNRSRRSSGVSGRAVSSSGTVLLKSHSEGCMRASRIVLRAKIKSSWHIDAMWMEGLLYKEGINVAAFGNACSLGLFECQHTRYFRSVGRFSQRCCDSRAPKLPGDTSQGGQLLAFTTFWKTTFAFWKQEQEHEVDWFPVQSIEIDRLSKAKKHPKRFFDFRKSRVRYGYAIAHTGGAEFFTFGQLCKYMLWRQLEPRSGFACQLKEQFLLVGDSDVDGHVFCREKVSDVHGSVQD
jgi:hypothetical protein